MKSLLLKHKHLFICLMVMFLLLPLTGCSKNDLFTSLGFSSRTADSPEALAMKGLDYYEHGKYRKAKESFEKLLSN